MSKRDMTKLQNVAVELDELTAEIETALKTKPASHYTMVSDGPVATAVTLFETGTKNINESITIRVSGKHIRLPAYVALAFRMAVIRINQPDIAKRPPSFSNMLPDVIGELHFLQDFILMTFSQDITLSASVELSTYDVGLIDTLLLTTSTTGNSYRTKVMGCSYALRSDACYFDLFDSATNGSVMVIG